MSDLMGYEVGVKNESGEYAKSFESPEMARVDDYVEIMKDAVSESLHIVRYDKCYRLISTTPHIVSA